MTHGVAFLGQDKNHHLTHVAWRVGAHADNAVSKYENHSRTSYLISILLFNIRIALNCQQALPPAAGLVWLTLPSCIAAIYAPGTHAAGGPVGGQIWRIVSAFPPSPCHTPTSPTLARLPKLAVLLTACGRTPGQHCRAELRARRLFVHAKKSGGNAPAAVSCPSVCLTYIAGTNTRKRWPSGSAAVMVKPKSICVGG